MSSILEALEKARQERERQRRELERAKKIAGTQKGNGGSHKPPDTEPPQTPPSPGGKKKPSTILVIVIVLSIAATGILGVSAYLFYRVETRLSLLDTSSTAQPVSPSSTPGIERRAPAIAGTVHSPTPDISREEQTIDEKKDTVVVAHSSPSPTPPSVDKSQKEPSIVESRMETSRPTTTPAPRKTQTPTPAPTDIPPATPMPEKRLAKSNQIVKEDSISALNSVSNESKKETPTPVVEQQVPTTIPADEETIRTEIKNVSAENLGLSIGSILWSEDNPLVLINGKILEEGDSIEDITVVTIHRKSLKVKKGDKQYNVFF